MIEIMSISKEYKDYNSFDDFYAKYRTAVAESYDEYTDNGHNWCWCLVGNIAKQHEYGENHEIKYGTKQFSAGAKVYIAPMVMGTVHENRVVIGLPRCGRKYIEVITRLEYIENFRMQKVFKPAVLKRMCGSEWVWWGDTENDRSTIIRNLERLSPENAQKEKQKQMAEQD